MGLRFRKSVTIFPGVRLNFSKSGVSLSLGVKGARFTVGSNGRKTASVGIPGTGVSYTKSFSGKKKKAAGKDAKKTSGKAAKTDRQEPDEEKSELEKELLKKEEDEEDREGGKQSKEIPWLVFGMGAAIVILLIVIIVMLVVGAINKKSLSGTDGAEAVTAAAENGSVPEGTAESGGNTGDAAALQDLSRDSGSATAAGAESKASKYVLNTSTKKFHKPSCSYAKSSDNTKTVTGTRDSLINEGYVPCGKCKP